MMWMIQILIFTRPCSCATTLDWWFSQISLKACKVVRLVVFNLIAVGEERLSKHWNVENGSRVNPGERLGAIGIEEVRRHPWFDSLNWPGRANSSCWFWKWWTWIRLYAYFNFSSGQAKLFACNDVECNINSGIHCCSLRFKKATFDSTFYSGHKVSNNLSSDSTFSLWHLSGLVRTPICSTLRTKNWWKRRPKKTKNRQDGRPTPGINLQLSHLSQHDLEQPSYRVFEKLSWHLCT